jgi:hypothetical protein
LCSSIKYIIGTPIFACANVTKKEGIFSVSTAGLNNVVKVLRNAVLKHQSLLTRTIILAVSTAVYYHVI